MPAGAKDGGWTEAKTVKFLTYVAFALGAGASPAVHFPAIAEKMGPDVTVSSLSNKWQRIKAEVSKEGGLPSTPTKNGGGKKGGAPRKTTTAASGSEDDEENATATPKSGGKRKANGATPKNKKAKVTPDTESEEGEVKELVPQPKKELEAEV